MGFCFLESTRVLKASGNGHYQSVSLKQLQSGDIIQSLDIHTGQLKDERVMIKLNHATGVRVQILTFVLETGGGADITLTPAHHMIIYRRGELLELPARDV